jgi:hypothetical protein
MLICKVSYSRHHAPNVRFYSLVTIHQMYRDFQDTSSSTLKKEQYTIKVFYLATDAQ